MVFIRVNIQELGPGAEVIQELSKRPRRDCPVMRRIKPVEPSVHWHRDLEGEVMCRREAISEDDTCNQTALGVLAVLDGNVAPIDERLPVSISGSLRA